MSDSCCTKKEVAVPPEKTFGAYVRQYKPLVLAAGLSLIGGMALGSHHGISFMNAAMGLFLCMLGLLQLLNLSGFVTALRSYDPLAKHSKIYAHCYPFLEILAGMLLLADAAPVFANLLILFIFGINTVGVTRVLKSGLAVQCACVGTMFSLPVGRVTFAENLIMLVMAGFSLIILA